MSDESTPEADYDCAAQGAATISVKRGLIDDEMRECRSCGRWVRWDLADDPFFGFAASCPRRVARHEKEANHE
jgi:hypothetical protein